MHVNSGQYGAIPTSKLSESRDYEFDKVCVVYAKHDK